MSKANWNLKDIIPEIGSKDYNQLLKKLEERTKFIENYRTKLKPEISLVDFMNIIKAEEEIAEISSRLAVYGYLWFSENTADQKAKSYRSKIEQITVDSSNRTMFFSLWFKDLDEKNAERIISQTPNEYKYMLRFLRITKKYTLSEKEEKIINFKDITGSNALIKLYDIITNDFAFKLKIKGKELELTREQLSSYVRNNDANIRKAAYQEMYRVYSENSDSLNELYRNIVLDWYNEKITLRKYDTPISAMNLANDVSAKAVNVLLESCRKNRHIFQEYFKLKSKFCKIKNFTRYDVYAPYKEIDKKYNYEFSQKLVFNAYKQYSEEMYKLAKKIVDEKHIDYEIRKNKMSGAYCYGFDPKITPYIMLNHNDKLRDVFTMAHELGHGVHDLLADKHSILTTHPPLVLAETASIFGEMLLFESLSKEIKNKEEKKSMLISKLDDIYASISRQAYFILFEIKAHEMIKKGADLNELNNVYLENLKEQFGSSVKVPEEFKYEWTSIPHIYHTPFYCYAYAFGNLLVLALYKKYKEEGKSFVPKYLKILSYGGSENPGKILKEVGIDIEDEKFWQSGFDIVKEMVDELKELK